MFILEVYHGEFDYALNIRLKRKKGLNRKFNSNIFVDMKRGVLV